MGWHAFKSNQSITLYLVAISMFKELVKLKIIPNIFSDIFITRDRTLRGSTTPGQNGPGSNYDFILPQSSRNGVSLPDTEHKSEYIHNYFLFLKIFLLVEQKLFKFYGSWKICRKKTKRSHLLGKWRIKQGVWQVRFLQMELVAYWQQQGLWWRECHFEVDCRSCCSPGSVDTWKHFVTG